VPTPTNAIVPDQPDASTDHSPIRGAISENAPCNTPMPRKNAPNQATADPKPARRTFAPPTSRSSMPMPRSGSARTPTSTLTPTSATSQPVVVVPTFAPSTTQTACDSVSSPALTKPTDATMTAPDDWTSTEI